MTRAHAAAIVAVFAVLTVVLWHGKVWPTWVCTHCDGAKETGPERSRARRACWWCGGTGRTRRLTNRAPWPLVLTVTAATGIGVLALATT